MKIMYLFSIVGLLMACGPGYGSVIAPQSLVDLEQRADLIVVGSATGTSQAGAAINLSLLITRVIKGDSTLSGKAISVGWAGAGRDAAQAVGTGGVAGAGIWFIQASPVGWNLLPVVQGDIPLAMTYIPAQPGPILGAYAYDSTAGLSDKVAAEVSSAIESGAGGYNFELSALENGLLDQLNSRYTQVLYSRMSTSALTPQQVLGLSGLIRGGSAAALLAAVQPSFAANATRGGILLLSIRDYFRSTDPTTTTALGQTAADSNNPNSALREAAAHALAAIHAAATLPYLAALLSDPDVNLRVEAVGGMGAFANGLPVQTNAGVPSLSYLQFPAGAPYMTAETRANFALGPQAIERNEGSSLAFWTQWWSQNRTGLGF